jgi:two-component system sensor histidine kinase BaeS
MKTLFSKILLAQVVAVALALIVVTAITRVSLNQGFKDFLKTQETSVLQRLAPALEEFYEAQGEWDFLRNKPQNWQHIWRLSRPQHGGPPPRGGPRPRRDRMNDDRPVPPGSSIEPQLLRWMMAPERGMLRERLFLLDEHRSVIAGAEIADLDGIFLEAIKFEGRDVGWIGFAPMGKALPPDAERFLKGQIRITVISLAVALIGAAALAFLLARNVSRPVRLLGDTVRKLSHGEYLARAAVETRDEIGRLAGHVNQLAESLEKNRSARQRWTADIAHELRTPVAILKGEIEALADGVRQADERMSNSLREEIDQLSTLIDDLQTLALSDAGALNIQKSPLNLSLLVGQCVDAFSDRLSARGISIDTREVEEVMIEADQPRLRQLLHNLLENNSRYVTENGQVRLSLARNQGVAELVLEDSGPGIEEEQLGRIFERFFRIESSRSRSGGGTGLGLSICKNIVEAHGGSILATHSTMGGLKIRIALPI